MAAPKRNYELKKLQLLIEFSCICVKNFNLLTAENQTFLFIILILSPGLPSHRLCNLWWRHTRPILVAGLVRTLKLYVYYAE